MWSLVVMAACCFQDFCVEPPDVLPIVEQQVEMISVANMKDGYALMFFWDVVQNEWVSLDHRWLHDDMAVTRTPDGWQLEWRDDADHCYRIVRTKQWVESLEQESPLAETNARPWWQQLLQAGIKAPPAVK